MCLVSVTRSTLLDCLYKQARFLKSDQACVEVPLRQILMEYALMSVSFHTFRCLDAVCVCLSVCMIAGLLADED